MNCHLVVALHIDQIGLVEADAVVSQSIEQAVTLLQLQRIDRLEPGTGSDSIDSFD